MRGHGGASQEELQEARGRLQWPGPGSASCLEDLRAQRPLPPPKARRRAVSALPSVCHARSKHWLPKASLLSLHLSLQGSPWSRCSR